MKNYLIVQLVLLFLSFDLAGTACAEDFYAQATVGNVTLNTPSNVGGLNVDAGGSGNGSAMKVLVGLPVSRAIGLEAGLITFGQIQIATPEGQVNTKDTIYLINAALTVPIWTNFALTARLGMAGTHSSVSIPAVDYASTSDQHPLYAGLELNYQLDKKWDLVVDVDHLGRTAEFERGDNQYTYSVNAGVRYRF